MAIRRALPLNEAVDRLIPKKRGTGRLPPAAARDAVDVSVAIAYPSAAKGTGIVSPWVEQYYDGAEGFYNLTSSDGLFVFEFGAETTYVDADGAGSATIVKHRDPDLPPP